MVNKSRFNWPFERTKLTREYTDEMAQFWQNATFELPIGSREKGYCSLLYKGISNLQYPIEWKCYAALDILVYAELITLLYRILDLFAYAIRKSSFSTQPWLVSWCHLSWFYKCNSLRRNHVDITFCPMFPIVLGTR